MKANLILLSLLTGALAARSQGTVFFSNRVLGPGGVIAPIYGPEPDDPFLALHGNTTTNGGYTTYHGALLVGPGYTVQLWGAPAGSSEDDLNLADTTTFRTSASSAGFFRPPSAATPIPGVPAGENATFQVRVWDNFGGTVTTWGDALANPLALRGASDLFTPPAPLGGGPLAPPNLVGLTSFNIHLEAVPEPSLWAMTALAMGVLWLRRRR